MGILQYLSLVIHHPLQNIGIIFAVNKNILMFIIRVRRNAKTLKQKIARRAENMLRNGWIDEARRAIANGLFSTPTAHQALGYRQIADYLDGRFSQEKLLSSICIATWQYARRQRTWFRHQHPEARVLGADAIP